MGCDHNRCGLLVSGVIPLGLLLATSKERLMYEISKNVPIPAEKVKHNYPHEALQVGESCFVPGGNMNVLCNYNRIRGKKLDRGFVCRKEGDGIRVWRVR